ncbi:MAG: XRE family transcriptional regulator [Methanoregula sp.]|jgi:Zn-dependent peptidase ImmA (M78 family)/DNA-binding XRE family transcriptional regulator|uniref:helix-turn-helix domain-containing protein n=1 Tax=Methanoregula sp. TaxID=2052170 RepID=UPI0025E76889|nr:XRE family transcriptional regulator [Methanoregula sp.]MCK9631034.1 XRE family transcriptional regulator [Methanoregula sp.]
MSLGENIKLRRETLRISLRDLAEKIGVSHTTINKYEKDLLVPDSQRLIKISTELQVPIASLLRPPGQQIQLTCLAFRTRKMLKRDERQINAETKDWLERYFQIERISGTSRSFEMPKGFPKKISSFEDAESAAKSLRKAWGLGNVPLENLTTLLEDKGIKIGIIKGITQFDALFTRCDSHPVIVMKENLPRARQRFSLAHELGHCLLEVEGEIDEEKAMHRFAGAFLVPAERIFFELGRTRQKITVRELLLLKEKYGFSMGAWLFRAKELGVISQDTYIGMIKLFSIKGWKKVEPHDDMKGEEPIFLATLVLKSHAEGIISLSKAAELLNQDISSFYSFEGESDTGQSATVCG